jgi:DNA polymerase III gamma/tau subunit
MTSIIINSFYRALCSINDYTPIKDMDMKKLAVTLVDALYPEDGYVTLDDEPRGNFKIHISDQMWARLREDVQKRLAEPEIKEEVTEPPKQEAVVPVAAPEPVEAPKEAPKEVKEVKTTKPKLTKEEKEAAKEAEKVAKAAAKEAEKAAVKAAKEAEKAAAKAAAKAAPKASFVGNLEKLNPTQEKTWKKVAAEAKVDLTDDHKKRFLAAVNALDNKVYNAKKLEVHMTEFFAAKEMVTKDQELWEPVAYKGKDYAVSDDGVVFDPETQEDGSVVYKKVGNVGMAYFKEMEQPTE